MDAFMKLLFKIKCSQIEQSVRPQLTGRPGSAGTKAPAPSEAGTASCFINSGSIHLKLTSYLACAGVSRQAQEPGATGELHHLDRK